MSATHMHRHLIPCPIVDSSSTGRPKTMFLRTCRPLLPRLRPTKRFSSSFSSSPTMNKNDAGSNASNDLDALFEAKHALRSKVRKALKSMDPAKRASEGDTTHFIQLPAKCLSICLSEVFLRVSDDIIQSFVVEAPWFKRCRSLCAYISCDSLREVDTKRIIAEALSGSWQEGHGQGKRKVYVPRVEDRNSNMRMLRISGVDDLVVNSMNILEPTLTDSDNNPCEDVMDASDPVDIIILPGLAFDRSGRRLGRSGGYYDQFLKKYNSIVKERMWVQPRLIALAYSVQLMEEGTIPITPYDVPVDALVTPAGFFRNSPDASDKHE